MGRKKKHADHTNHERWLLSYADFITLLMAFFVVMFAVSQVDAKKAGRFQEEFRKAVGIPSQAPMSMPQFPQTATPPTLEDIEIVSQGAHPVPGSKLKDIQVELSRRIRFEGMFAGMKLLWRGNDLVLRLDATAVFESGDDAVRPAAKILLAEIAKELHARKLDVRIEGHTDDQPIKTLRFRSNWDLSTARAVSVVHEMVAADGIDPHHIAAMGYGEFQPIGSNLTKEGRALNRRVDFVLAEFKEVPTVDMDASGKGPEGAAAGGGLSDGNATEDNATEGRATATDGNATESLALEAKPPEGKAPEGTAPEGKAPSEHAPSAAGH